MRPRGPVARLEMQRYGMHSIRLGYTSFADKHWPLTNVPFIFTFPWGFNARAFYVNSTLMASTITT